jgi:hypothetical protein
MAPFTPGKGSLPIAEQTVPGSAQLLPQQGWFWAPHPAHFPPAQVPPPRFGGPQVVPSARQ